MANRIVLNRLNLFCMMLVRVHSCSALLIFHCSLNFCKLLINFSFSYYFESIANFLFNANLAIWKGFIFSKNRLRILRMKSKPFIPRAQLPFTIWWGTNFIDRWYLCWRHHWLRMWHHCFFLVPPLHMSLHIIRTSFIFTRLYWTSRDCMTTMVTKCLLRWLWLRFLAHLESMETD